MRLKRENLLTFAGGAVVTAVLTLAGKSYLATESTAEEAQSKNFQQQTQIELVIQEQEAQKQELRWLRDAMMLVLLDRGLKPPPQEVP